MTIDTSQLSLGQAQQLFVRLEAKWVAWCLEQPGWGLRHGEGCILEKGAKGLGRRAWLVDAGGARIPGLKPVMVEDAVHLDDGQHYRMLAEDWQLFVNGVWIDKTSDPAWQAAGEKAEELGLSWGGRFGDGNHISLAWGGKR